MSLINDALRRVQKTIETNPPPESAPLQFRPADQPAPTPANTPPVLYTLVFLCLIGIASLIALLWPGRDVERVQARSALPPETNIAQTEPDHPIAFPAIDLAWKAASVLLTDAPPAALIAPSNALPADATARPATPPSLKLQAILFEPTRPSAIVNGNTVFQGDRVGQWRVSRISRNSVTLVGAQESKVLTLE